MKLIRILIILLQLSFISAITYAQSASDLYNTGITLMKKKDYDGAIKSFNASMTINKSEANVKNCTTRINECNWYKSQLKKKEVKEEEKVVVVEPELSVSTHEIHVNSKGNSELTDYSVVNVTATPDAEAWTVEPIKGGWYEIELSSDKKKFEVHFDENNSDSMRTSIIIVKNGDKEEKITLRQDKKIDLVIGVNVEGKQVKVLGVKILDKADSFAEVSDIRVNAKGNQVVFVVNSNADARYENGLNWHIVSMPTWIKRLSMKKDGKKSVAAMSNELVLEISRLNKKTDGSYRFGEIVIESQDVVKTINVLQE